MIDAGSDMPGIWCENVDAVVVVVVVVEAAAAALTETSSEIGVAPAEPETAVTATPLLPPAAKITSAGDVLLGVVVTKSNATTPPRLLFDPDDLVEHRDADRCNDDSTEAASLEYCCIAECADAKLNRLVAAGEDNADDEDVSADEEIEEDTDERLVMTRESGDGRYTLGFFNTGTLLATAVIDDVAEDEGCCWSISSFFLRFSSSLYM